MAKKRKKLQAEPPGKTATVLPERLQKEVDEHWQAYTDAAIAAGVSVPAHPDFLRSLQRVWAASAFVARSCIRHPLLLPDLLETGDLLGDYAAEEYADKLRAAVAAAGDEAELGRLLRQVRRREMVRIAWRDLAGWAGLDEVLRDLSALADACVNAALERLFAWQSGAAAAGQQGRGTPALSFVVLGMGKLGAHELNFSSDIDLIFAYPDSARPGRQRDSSPDEFFARLGQSLIRSLGETTEEGFVYRVDMRLRPWGDSGPLALSFGAIEEYYQSHGREWERYAFVKARPIAGDLAAGAELMELLRPFVYRRYIDYGVFEQLRAMKAMIKREVERRGLNDNIKLGPGGIREVEFIAQVFQLVRGGREPRLRERRLLRVLKNLVALKLMPAAASEQLGEAYRFLRRVENRLQAWNDEQTHRLPRDPEGQARLAWAMGFANWESFHSTLAGHRRVVEQQFEQIFTEPRQETAPASVSRGTRLGSLWHGQLDEAAAKQVLRETGFARPEEALRLLLQFRDSSLLRMIGSNGRRRLERLMPLLLAAVGEGPQPDDILPRVMHLIEAIAGRSTYLALLIENPMALSQLVRLCSASPWIAHELTRHPLLLDELLDPRQLYAPLRHADLESALRQLLESIPADDLEQQMDALRQFKQANALRVAAAEVVGAAPLMVVSDYLTDIAETVLSEVLALAWQDLVARHGKPVCTSGGKSRRPGFAIIAYGKLGGIELSYGSDLDLVFLHNSSGEAQRTDGPRPLDNAVFFVRLGQRIIHLLNTLTPAGVLYEVDMRLRPSGAAGLLVSSLESFTDYQRREAWTWEHQALVRARPVAGDRTLAEAFLGVRREILCRARDERELRQAVREMRERMRAELGTRRSGRFDLKQDPGGIADIEFMVQYKVLSGAHQRPELVQYSDNVRLLEGLAGAGLIASADAELLTEAYKAYRARVHELTLQEESTVVGEHEFAEYRQRVTAIWEGMMVGSEG
jgi:glutamate-ammonia-ligase adenylyltransferase